jgi:hypothetical protein
MASFPCGIRCAALRTKPAQGEGKSHPLAKNAAQKPLFPKQGIAVGALGGRVGESGGPSRLCTAMLGQKAEAVHPSVFPQRMRVFLGAGFLRLQPEKRSKDRHLPFEQKKGRANARPKSNREVITGKKNSITRYEAGDRRMRVILQGFWRQPKSMADMRFVHGSFLQLKQ